MDKAGELVTIQQLLNEYHKRNGETPSERYRRRIEEEFDPLKVALAAKEKEIADEFHKAQKTCLHVDNGGFMYGFCIFCSEPL
jgi:hypothetical protein